MSDPTRRHISAMNSALEPRRGVGRHSQAANTDDGQLARRACTAAINQVFGGRGSTLPTINRDAGVITHPQVSHMYSFEKRTLIQCEIASILRDIWNLRFFRNEIDRIPSTLATVTEADLMDLEVRIAYQAHVEDFVRARTELLGMEQQIRRRIVMLKPRLRRELWEQHGERVNEELGFF